MSQKLKLMSVTLLSMLTVNLSSAALIKTEGTPFSESELQAVKANLFHNIATNREVWVKKDGDYTIFSIPGAVLASPSLPDATFSQDYQFHWVRDAAITMDEVVKLYVKASGPQKKALKQYLINYVNFERKAQTQISRSGEKTLGQPKYNMDAMIWEGPWARPQNDGPALRAITLIEIAKLFKQENENVDYILDMIAMDLNYVAVEWHNPTFDLWEEVSDRDHFFTKMVQRKALLDGAEFFKQVGRTDKVDTYTNVAGQITSSLNQHWNVYFGYFTETLYQLNTYGGGLDSSVLLGILYGDLNDPLDPFSLTNDRVLKSVYYIRNAFTNAYQLNLNNANTVPLLGRYPGDIYDGYQFKGGNPWPLVTNALAQFYYALANEYVKTGQITVTALSLPFFQQVDSSITKEMTVTKAEDAEKFSSIINHLVAAGDDALDMVKAYSVCYEDQTCFHIAEQIDRVSGQPVSAKDLTWGYTTLLAAMRERSGLVKN